MKVGQLDGNSVASVRRRHINFGHIYFTVNIILYLVE